MLGAVKVCGGQSMEDLDALATLANTALDAQSVEQLSGEPYIIETCIEQIRERGFEGVNEDSIFEHWLYSTMFISILDDMIALNSSMTGSLAITKDCENLIKRVKKAREENPSR